MDLLLVLREEDHLHGAFGLVRQLDRVGVHGRRVSDRPRVKAGIPRHPTEHRPRPRVLVIRFADRPFGGDVYEAMVATTLGRVYPVVDYTIPPAGRGPRRYWNVLRTVWDVRRRVPRQQPKPTGR